MLNQNIQEYIISLASVALKPKFEFYILCAFVEFINLTLNAYIGIKKVETIILETKADPNVAHYDDVDLINLFLKYS